MKKKAPIIIIVVLIIIVVIGMMLYSDNIKSNKDSSESTESLSESELEQEAPTVEQSTTETPDAPVYYDTTEDANGDGIISYAEDMADGIPGFTLHYNNDDSNTTYMVNYKTGQVIHPGDSFVNENGMTEVWYGTTQEDIESVEGKVVE